MFSSYVKVPQLKKILDEESECEKKLDLIRNLVEGQKPVSAPPPPPTESNNAEKISGDLSAAPAGGSLPEAGSQDIENSGSAQKSSGPEYAKILEGVKGSIEKKTAILILDLISQSKRLSYDSENLELIIDGERVRYTNVQYLIKRVVSGFPAQYPIGLTLFIQELKNINVPLHAFRGGDAKNIWDDLNRIKKEKEKSHGDSASANEGVKEKESELKRKLPEEGEEESAVGEVEAKRPRLEASEVEGGGESELVRWSYGQTKESISKLRRSARLKKSLQKSWESVGDDG